MLSEAVRGHERLFPGSSIRYFSGDVGRFTLSTGDVVDDLQVFLILLSAPIDDADVKDSLIVICLRYGLDVEEYGNGILVETDAVESYSGDLALDFELFISRAGWKMELELSGHTTRRISNRLDFLTDFGSCSLYGERTGSGLRFVADESFIRLLAHRPSSFSIMTSSGRGYSFPARQLAAASALCGLW